MNGDINQIILTELQGLRKDVTEGFSETKQRLTAVETLTDPFFEKEGTLFHIHEDIKSLNKTKYMAIGGAGVITTVGHWLLHKIGF